MVQVGAWFRWDGGLGQVGDFSGGQVGGQVWGAKGQTFGLGCCMMGGSGGGVLGGEVSGGHVGGCFKCVCVCGGGGQRANVWRGKVNGIFAIVL